MSSSPPVSPRDPGFGPVLEYLLYGLSLPERMLRSTASLAAGAARESAELLLPHAFRSSRTYTVFVKQMLDFLAEDVGGVARRQPTDGQTAVVENFVARKAVGNFIEMTALATLRASPILVLAVVSDIAYGSTAYLRELGEELKRRGLIAESTTLHSTNDLLTALGQTSGSAARVFDTPPLSVAELRQSLGEIRAALARVEPTKVLPRAEIARLWEEMAQVAQENRAGLLDVSTGMAMYAVRKLSDVGRGTCSGIQVAGALAQRHLLAHYQEALSRIRTKGLYRHLAETADPYLEAAWRNFSHRNETFTQRLLRFRWLSNGWQAARGWLRSRAAPQTPPAVLDPPPETSA